jgi:hypothetical protein
MESICSKLLRCSLVIPVTGADLVRRRGEAKRDQSPVYSCWIPAYAGMTGKLNPQGPE